MNLQESAPEDRTGRGKFQVTANAGVVVCLHGTPRSAMRLFRGVGPAPAGGNLAMNFSTWAKSLVGFVTGPES